MAATKTEIMAVFDSLCKILICYSCHKDSPPFGWLSFFVMVQGFEEGDGSCKTSVKKGTLSVFTFNSRKVPLPIFSAF